MRIPNIYRVFPYLPAAADDEPGGVLYIPPQGAGRFDNPGEYEILYAAQSPEGAVAEAFGRHPIWTASVMEGIPALPGSVHALATIELADTAKLYDLDDARCLTALNMRPSDVVNRDYTVTQAAALRIFTDRASAGLQWWSYYNPAWRNVGVWDSSLLGHVSVKLLSIGDALVFAAARAIVRMIQP